MAALCFGVKTTVPAARPIAVAVESNRFCENKIRLDMQATVNLPDALYEKTEALAVLRGTTVEQIIVGAVADAVQENLEAARCNFGDREIDFPLIRSGQPGTLDLSGFDFDDLLA